METTKSIKRKEMIVQIAKRHFATLGYDTATLKGIAVDAQTTASSLTYYFSSKEYLLDQALRETVCNFSSRIVQISCSRGSAGELLAKMADTYFAFLRNDADLQTILDREATHLAGRPLFDYLAGAQSDIDDAWANVLGDILMDDPSMQSKYRVRTAKRVIDAFDIMAVLDGTECDERTKIYLRNKLIEQITSALSAPMPETRVRVANRR